MLDFYYCLDWAYLEVERRGAAAARCDRRQRDRPAAVGAGVGGGLPRARTTTRRPAGKRSTCPPDRSIGLDGAVSGRCTPSRPRTGSPRAGPAVVRAAGRRARRSGPSRRPGPRHPGRGRARPRRAAGRPPRSARRGVAGHPLVLGRVDPEQPEAVHQLDQVARGRRDDHERAVRVERPGGTRPPLRGANTFSSTCRGAVRERQRAPGVGEQRRRARGWARAARRSAGFETSRARPAAVAWASSTRGEVVAGARRRHRATRPRSGVRRGSGLGDRRRSVPAARNASRAATISAVSPLCGSASGAQVGVALPGDVEAVPARAAQRAGLGRRSDRRGTPGSAGSGTTSARSCDPHALVSVHGRNRLSKRSSRPRRRCCTTTSTAGCGRRPSSSWPREIGHELPADRSGGARAAGSSRRPTPVRWSATWRRSRTPSR